MYGCSVDELAAYNKLSNASQVEIGQYIFIPSRKTVARRPAHRPSPVSNEDFVWPVRGKVVSCFGATNGSGAQKGITIAAASGSDVVASRSGKVVFCDDAFQGFGRTIIIDHGDAFSSVYAYNDVILVRVGDYVKQRAVIAKVGSTGRASQPSLHFEIRKHHKAQNPFFYLKGS